jgi:iron only hydrogenase large subunit-like protein
MPELKPFVSDTPTPMHYAAEIAGQRFPGTKAVFIGPCVAKRVEGMADAAVHSVLTFEELAALFQAARINPAEMPEDSLGAGASGESRNYAVSGGVAGAVRHLAQKVEAVPVLVNGLSRIGLKQLNGYASGNCPGNLVEVMACEGGCVGGSGVLVDPGKSARAVESFSGIKRPKNS